MSNQQTYICISNKVFCEFIRDSAEVLMGIFDDLDKVLRTNKNFLLGNWLNLAKALATNDAVSVIFCMKCKRSIFFYSTGEETV